MRLLKFGCPCFTAVALFVMGAALPGGPVAGQAQNAPAGESARKPAWRWSVDERIAARVDPARAAARRARLEAQQEKWRTLFGIKSHPDVRPSIEGRTEPELLMPTELFSALISDAFPEDGQPNEMKERIEEGAVVLGFGNDLWPRLERVTAPYLRLRKENYERAMAGRALTGNEDKSQQLLGCRARAEALARAKAEFGDEHFLRLLYEVVATTLSVTYTGEDGTASHLRFMEGGCR